MNIGIVLAGGVGSRFGSNVPKQYLTINGKEVIAYSIEALQNASSIDKIIVVARGEQKTRLAEKYDGVITVEGGDSRNESLYNALSYIAENHTCENVIILEAARPMITAKIVDTYLEKLKEYDAAITGQKIVASLGCFHAHVVDRSEYYLIEAPEAFRFKLLYDHFDKNSKITATNQQLPEGSKLYINFDFTTNLKITYPMDLSYCEALKKNEKEL